MNGKKRIIIGGLLIVGMLSVFSISVSNGSRETPEKFMKPSERGPKLIPDNKFDSTFMTVGSLPAFKDETAVHAWLEKLKALSDRLDGADVPFWGPNGVVMHGMTGDGFYRVWIKEGVKIDNKMISDIVSKINRVAKGEIGFKRDVPVKFEWSSGVKEDKARDDKWRPVIGGIQVQNVDSGHLFTSTLGWAAKKDSTKGFVIAGHLGYNRPTQVSATIYQPTWDPPKPTGDVSDVGGTYADVAWVPFGDVSPQVYVSGIGYYIHFYQDPAVGDDVNMSGITSGLQTGTVVGFADVSGTVHGTLLDQALADYARAGGDSGAPVYIAVSGYGRGIVGVHVGLADSYAYFSQTSGVEKDVGVVPITY